MDCILKTPVTLIIFKREDTTRRVLEAIREVRPQKLYIIADAAREDRFDESKKVEATRLLVENYIDWDCEIKKNYAKRNMGCKKRVESGISWVLSQEEETIILEDDIVPSTDFFFFCQEMLERYRNNKEVLMVSGYKRVENYVIDKPYFFSAFSSIWGWATWRRAWKLYDTDLTTWPQNKKNKNLQWLMSYPSLLWVIWETEYTYRKEIDSWAFVWNYSRYYNKGIGIVPGVNLIENIGFNLEDATHTKGMQKRDFSYGKMNFPISEVFLCRDMEYDREYIRRYYNGWKAIVEFCRKALFYIGRKIRKIFTFRE